MSFYPNVIAKIRNAIFNKYPNARATEGFATLQDPAGYALWMLARVEEMDDSRLDLALKAARWIGWTLCLVEEHPGLKLWNNIKSRQILGDDISRGYDKPAKEALPSFDIVHKSVKIRFGQCIAELINNIWPDGQMPSPEETNRLKQLAMALLRKSEVNQDKHWKRWSSLNKSDQYQASQGILTEIDLAIADLKEKNSFDPKSAKLFVPGIGHKSLSDLSESERSKMLAFLQAGKE